MNLGKISSRAYSFKPGPRHFWSNFGNTNLDNRIKRASSPFGFLKDLPEVKHIVAVSSAKGGVGKSTVCLNLGIGMTQLGLKVGILDADVNRPSLPGLMGMSKTRIESTYVEETNTEHFDPLVKYGIQCMSLGFLPRPTSDLDDKTATRCLLAMFDNVKWKDLDVLLVDFPAGTGDLPISCLSKVTFKGAVVVTTPSPAALDTVVRGIDMIKQAKVPILGIVENMSSHKCPKCGSQDHVLGQGNSHFTQELEFDVLGQIPLNSLISEANKNGKPLGVSDSPSFHGGLFRSIATRIKIKLETQERERIRAEQEELAQAEAKEEPKQSNQ